MATKSDKYMNGVVTLPHKLIRIQKAQNKKEIC